MKTATNLQPRWLLWLNGLLLVPAIVSITQGVRNALTRSQDFQWSGAHLLVVGQDPYLQYLRHDPQHLIQASQTPNYLQELYVMLWPLGALTIHHATEIWTAFNLICTLVTVVLLGHIFKLGAARTALLGLLWVMSTPHRVAIGNGQQSLFEVMLLVVALAAGTRAGLPLGLSYFKYSFSPMVVFYVALKRRWLLILVSLIAPVVGWLLLWAKVGGSLMTTALEPLMVSRTGVSPGDGDVATLFGMLGMQRGGAVQALLLLLCAGCAYWVYRRGVSVRDAAAALAVLDLMILPHLVYDYVLLVIPAALLLRSECRRSARWIVSATVMAIFWYVFKLLPAPHFRGGLMVMLLFHMALLLVLALALPQADEAEKTGAAI